MQKATITLNGVEKEVSTFIPELTGDLAIVHLSVLKRLAALLPHASFSTIRKRVSEDILMTLNINELIMVLENELAFQTSVNQIILYEPEEVKTGDVDLGPKVVGKIKLNGDMANEFNHMQDDEY